MPESPGRVRVERLTAGYGRRQVLTSVDLELAAGRTLALMGPGGGGKSTLLEVLAGGRAGGLWCEGKVEVGGSPVRRMRQTPRPCDRSLGAVLAPELGGLESGRLREIWNSAPAAAEFLIAARGMVFGHLPVGTRRLASLTLAFARSAPVILLDEPTADQDSRLESWVLAKLRADRRRSTVVVVTHDLRLARQVADEVALLIEGRIVESAAVRDFFENPRHERAREFARLGC